MSKNIDKFEANLEENKIKLQECQESKKIDSCLKCDKVLECIVRDEYIKAVYRYMNKGKGGGFEF